MQQCGQIPLRLFSIPHPKAQSPVIKPIGSPITLPGNFDFILTKAGFHSRSDSEIIFYAVTETNIVYRLKYQLKTLKVTKEQIFVIQSFTSLEIFSHILIIGSANGQMFVMDFLTHDQSKFFPHIGRINCIATDNRYMVTGGADTSTNIHSAELPYVREFAVPSYSGEVISVDVCSEFAAVVSGTRDGSVLIFSLTSRTVVHVLKLNGKTPERIMISRKWGFIVVYETEIKSGVLLRYIEVFTINGVFVRKKQISFDISLWCTFTTKKGFDFMVLADTKGSLYVFEVFYVNLEKPFFRCGDRLAELSYVQEKRLVIALSCNGMSFLIPLQVNK
jgi:WD40 repeat protein